MRFIPLQVEGKACLTNRETRQGRKHVLRAPPPRGAAFLLAGVCTGSPGRGAIADADQEHDKRSSLDGLWLGAGQRPESGGPVLHSDSYSAAAGSGTELLSAAVRRFNAATVFAIYDCLAPQ